MASRRLGLVAPSFQGPPGDAGVDRSLRQLPDGGGVAVMIRLWPRSLGDIRNDMIDGVIAANGLRGRKAAEVRRVLERVVPIPDARAASQAAS